MPTEARFYLLPADPPRRLRPDGRMRAVRGYDGAGLMVAWEARRVEYSNCGVALRLDDGVLARLREQVTCSPVSVPS